MAASISLASPAAGRTYEYQIADPSSTTVSLPAWLIATVGTGWTHTQRAESTSENSLNRFNPSGSAGIGDACSLVTGATKLQVNFEHKFEITQWRHSGGGHVSRYDGAMFIGEVSSAGAESSPTCGVWWEYRAGVNKAFIRWTTAVNTFAELEVPDLNIREHSNALNIALSWIPNQNIARIWSEGEIWDEIALTGSNGGATGSVLIRAGIKTTCQIAAGNSNDYQEYKRVRWTRY